MAVFASQDGDEEPVDRLNMTHYINPNNTHMDKKKIVIASNLYVSLMRMFCTLWLAMYLSLSQLPQNIFYIFDYFNFRMITI